MYYLIILYMLDHTTPISLPFWVVNFKSLHDVWRSTYLTFGKFQMRAYYDLIFPFLGGACLLLLQYSSHPLTLHYLIPSVYWNVFAVTFPFSRTHRHSGVTLESLFPYTHIHVYVHTHTHSQCCWVWAYEERMLNAVRCMVILSWKCSTWIY